MVVMNEAALKSMTKMIQVMLPYEGDYEPNSLGTICLSEIFEALKVHSPKIIDFEGFFNYVLKGMDMKNDSSSGPSDTGHSQAVNVLDEFLIGVRDILLESYPVTNNPLWIPVASSESIGHPKDSDVGEDDS